jgi:hypothetical protein
MVLNKRVHIKFHILLTVNLCTILVNNQLDALFSMYLFILLLYMFRATQCLSSGELIYQYIIWYVSLCVGDCLVCRSGGNSWPAHQTVTYAESYIPHNVLIQLISLMVSTGFLDVENWNKKIRGKSGSRWLLKRRVHIINFCTLNKHCFSATQF